MNKGKIFKLAKGFRGRAKNCIRIARERVEKALQYSYRDRRTKKRDMRSLWIQRINAGTRIHGVCFKLCPYFICDAFLRELYKLLLSLIWFWILTSVVLLSSNCCFFRLCSFICSQLIYFCKFDEGRETEREYM